MKMGNFDIDMSNGDIRFKYYVTCYNDIVPDDTTLEKSILCPALMFDKYENAFIKILFKNESGKDAFDDCNINNLSEFKTMLKNILNRYRSSNTSDENESEDAACSDFDDDEADEEKGGNI